MLELVIGQNGPPHTVRWFRDGHPLGAEFALDGAAVRRLDEVRFAFQTLFERGGRPLTDPVHLRAMGSVLFETFFRPVASEVGSMGGERPQRWLIRSAAPAFLNLPWELVSLPGSALPLGCDPAWALLRVPLESSTA